MYMYVYMQQPRSLECITHLGGSDPTEHTVDEVHQSKQKDIHLADHRVPSVIPGGRGEGREREREITNLTGILTTCTYSC